MNKDLKELNELIQVIRNSIQQNAFAKYEATKMEASLDEIMKKMGLPRMHTNRRTIATDTIYVCDKIKPIVVRLMNSPDMEQMNLDVLAKDMYTSLIHIRYVI